MGKKLEILIERLMAFLLSMMILLLFLQVITRFIFMGSILWAGELSVWLFVWITFLGSSLLLYRNEHMVVNLLEMILPVTIYYKIKTFLNIFIKIFIYSFLAIVFYNSIPVIISISNQYATSFPVSKVFLFSSLPVSIILMFIFLIISIMDFFREAN